MPQPVEHVLGHPKGLYVLALTEMWERFSYYGMRALLVFFLTERLLFSDQLAFSLYGSYTALVYITPLLGGLLADRYLGCSRAVIFGAILMLIGHVGLAVDDLLLGEKFAGIGSADTGGLQLFYLSLAFLIVGVGLLKPNISTMVGGLYPAGGHLRDSGFTLFVLGINLGATLSAVLCGYVGQRFGWGYGFGLAAVGVLIGLLIFVGGQRHLQGHGLPPRPELLQQRVWGGFSRQALIGLAVVAGVLVIWLLVQMLQALGYVVAGTFAVVVVGVLVFAATRLERGERRRLHAALMLMAIWIVFAALIEQMGSSINLFTERVVNRDVGFTQLRSAQLQGLLPFLIILLSPAFAWLWGYLQARGRNPSTPVKFALALLLLAAGYGAIVCGLLWPDQQGRVLLAWLCLLYLLFAAGDLLIVPVGLSAMTKLATAQIMGLMMGLWMMSVAIGNYFAAKIAGFSAMDPQTLQSAAPEQVLSHYRDFFAALAIGALLTGVLTLLAAPTIRRWMHPVR